MNVLDTLCDTDTMLYIPETGDTVPPDIISSETGCAISYARVVPAICTEKFPLNCVASAFTSFMIFADWKVSAAELLHEFTTSAEFVIEFPLPSTANPTCVKFMLDML